MFWLLLTLLVVALMSAVFALGFRLGGRHWQKEVLKVRLQAAQAERRLHDLTREAFVAMADHAERRSTSR